MRLAMSCVNKLNLLNKGFKKDLVKLIALQQHKIHLIIILLSSSYSIVF